MKKVILSLMLGLVALLAKPAFSQTIPVITPITLSDSTPGSIIYYTLDGSAPTTSSTVYTEPIVITQTTTINAIAVAPGFSQSAVASATYTIVQTVAAPTFGVTGGTYTSAQKVSMSDTTANALIYYTTDGSAPTTTSAVYSQPIPVSATMTIKAMAVVSGLANSSVTSATYTINLPAATPTFSPAAGTYTTSQNVTIKTTTPNSKIYYSIGSTPTTSSSVYSTTLRVTAPETINAMVVAVGYSNSKIGSAVYAINLPTAPAPGVSAPAGTYVGSVSVKLNSPIAGAAIYYTTNGTAPSKSSTLYTGAITISKSCTLKAVVTASNYKQSPASSVTYTITKKS